MADEQTEQEVASQSDGTTVPDGTSGVPQTADPVK